MVYFPVVAYFIAFCEHAACNQEKLFATIHTTNMEHVITEIKTMYTADIADAEKAAGKIFQVVKDHNSASISTL